MFTLRADQLEALGRAAARRARDGLVQHLRAQGLQAQASADGNLITISDAAGGGATLRFSGRQVEVTSATGRAFLFAYDAKNRVESITDTARQCVRFSYDPKGRLTAVQRDSGQAYRFDYDSQGCLQALHFPDQSVSRYEHDERGRVVCATDRMGHTVHYDCSVFGQPERIVRGPDRVSTYSADDHGDIEAASLPGGRNYRYLTHQAEGSADVLLNGRPQVRCSVDTEGEAEILGYEYPDGSWTRHVLDRGRLSQASTESSSLQFNYDALSLVESEASDGKLAVKYERNAVGAITAIEAAGIGRIEYVRDTDHRLVGIRDWNGRTFELRYDASGALSLIRYPNGATVSRGNNAWGLPESITVATSAGAEPQSRTFRHDECDRVSSETLPDGRHRVFSYDANGRLVGVTSPDAHLAEFFVLDAYGNCLQHNGSTASFSASDQIVSHAGHSIRHDAQGCVTEAMLPTGPATLEHDDRGRLVQVDTPRHRVRYAYDAIGRRIAKDVQTHDGQHVSQSRYVWAGTLLLAETVERRGLATQRRRYLPAPDLALHLAQDVDGIEGFIHHGRRLEPLCMTDAAGNVVWSAEYSAFAQCQVSVAQADQPFRLPGQYFDPETGLHYNLARFYHPGLGRFLQRDPLGYAGGSWNEYLYGDGDPLNRLDPTGEFIPILLAGAAIGGAIGAGVEMYRQHRDNPDAPFDWGKIGKEALIGGAVGVIGAAVGIALLPVAAALGSGLAAVAAGGALVGGVSAAIEACAEAAIRGAPITPADLARSGLIGMGIGAITAGVGSLLFRRLRRLRQKIQPKDSNVSNQPTGPVGKTESALPDGLAYRPDLPKHLAGPDGFTKSGLLSGTHNLDNATAALDAKGATYTLTPTGTDGISVLSYSYAKPTSGKIITGSKTVYDPAVFSDQTMLDYSLKAGHEGWTRYLADPTTTTIDVTHGGVNFRTYINVDQFGNPYVGNVHPIR